MYDAGTRVTMTKGYQGTKGEILSRLESQFEFYVVKLDNEIHIVVGPSAFAAEGDRDSDR